MLAKNKPGFKYVGLKSLVAIQKRTSIDDTL